VTRPGHPLWTPLSTSTRLADHTGACYCSTRPPPGLKTASRGDDPPGMTWPHGGARHRRAGTSATRRYKSLSKAWRRGARKEFLKVGCIFSAVAVIVNAVAFEWPRWIWAAGVVTGSMLGVFVALRGSPPPWIENWQDGAWAEERTGKVLHPLQREGWTVLHDLPATYGNLDHVVVGPGGVFLLDTKRWRGDVTVEGDTAVIQRRGGPRGVVQV